MSKSIEVAKEAIKKNCNPIEISDDFNQLQISISTNQILDVVDFIKNDEACEFRQITDIAGVDFPDRQKRFEVIYHFLSFKHNSRLRIKIIIGEDESIPSITSIFPAANWFEREAFDMYGIQFKDHPDLRRILTDYGFEGHPLRKDFPLTGHSEVRYSEDQKKVISEPVKLEQNYRNFDYESPWEGTKYIKEKIENNDKKN